MVLEASLGRASRDRPWVERGVWSPATKSGRLVDSPSALGVGPCKCAQKHREIGQGNSQPSGPGTTVNYYCVFCWDDDMFKVFVSNLGIHQNHFQAIKNNG